jgi:signal transduction histidine kinase/ligand-binding sensor domain-containing protein
MLGAGKVACWACGRRRLRVRGVLAAALFAGVWTAPGAGLAQDVPLHAGSPPKAAAVPRWSAIADLLVQRFTTDNGLIHPTVTAIAEDGDGFLWVGSQGGLARWDGYRFRAYRPDPKNPHSLPDNNVTRMYADPKGRLWIGTMSGGLARYDPGQDQFIRYPVGPGGLSGVRVSAIDGDGACGLWIGTPNGLDHLDPETGALRHLRHVDQAPGGLPGNAISAVLHSRDGALWVGTAKGLVRRAAGGRQFEAVTFPMTGGNAPIASRLYEDSGGRIWVGTPSSGAYVVQPHAAAAIAIGGDAPAGSLLSESISAITEARPGEIWLGTLSQSVVSVDAVTLHARRLLHDPNLPNSLRPDNIWVFYRDHSGLLWMGTSRGLDRLDPLNAAFLHVIGPSSREDGISDHDVLYLTSAADGRIWMALLTKGVDVVDPVNGRVASLRPVPGQPEAALQLPVLGIAAVPDGDVYLATRSGLYRAAKSGKRLQRMTLPPRDPAAPIVAIASDADRLWIGGGDDGLWVLNRAGMTSATRFPGNAQLSDQHIQVIERAPDGYLWVGTANGLNRLDTATQTVERILPDRADRTALAAGRITSLMTDRRGRLWVATQGGGVHVLESRDATGRYRFRRIGVDQGLPHANADKLLLDDAGNIWVSTDNGLAIINQDTGAVRALQRADGVFILDYQLRSGVKTAGGELLFGGTSGVTVVRPALLKEWTYRPPVVVTDIRLGGEPFPAARFNGAASAQAVPPLLVKPEANSIAVEFSALDYSAPERNRYAYRLDGYDQDWVATDATRRLASYTNLASGDYRLRVRGSNRNGVWTERELDVPIRVLPAWYQTWWFRAAEALAAGLAIFCLVQARTRYLRRRAHQLRTLVRERTAQLREKQGELLSANRELARINKRQEEHQNELTRFLAVASHDLRQPLHAVNLYLGALLHFDLSAPAKSVLDNLRQCVHVMNEMFLSLLDLSRLDAQVVAPCIEDFPIQTLLSRIGIEFLPQAKAKGLEFHVAPCSVTVRSDAALVEQILRNLVANAVRYTKSGKILIGCRRRGDSLRLAVYDTGVGIAPDQQSTVFDQFAQIDASDRDRGNKGLGLGLAIVKRLARLLDTQIILVSLPGSGSMFAVDLPLAAAAALPPQLDGTSAETNPASPPTTGLAGKTVVVVDDDQSILDGIRLLLNQWGCIAVTALSGQDILRKLADASTPPDALICDHRLGTEPNGLDLVAAIREEFNCDIPALIITGDIEPDRLIAGVAAELTVLHKPVGSATLHRTLVRLIAAPHGTE